MKHHSMYEIGTFFSTALDLAHMGLVMNHKRLGIFERMEEVMGMCSRKNPVYDQLNSFSVALYTIGLRDGGSFHCPDLMSCDDVDSQSAGRILCEHFTKISKESIPSDYHITKNSSIYLLVVGDPLFPRHFAVVTNQRSERPYFSKLPFFGAGFDSLDELKREFLGIDGVRESDFHFFQSTCD